MDETSSSSSSRKKSDVVEVDRISTMPCSIIHHILSFVPTKDAVRTSVLSTRWKDIWIGTPVVDIRSSWRDVTETSTINHLMNFMDKLLLAHDGHNIDKFHVSFFDFCCNPARIVSWITTLLAQHKVKILELFFGRVDFDGTFSFPRSYFTSLESLTEMSIHLWSKAEMEISVCLNLKVLHLCDVVLFCDDHLTQESSFTFPNLEEFALDSCYWENTKKTIHIHAPRLRALIIQDESDDQWVEKQKIEVYAASLTSFTINGDLLPKYYLCDLSRLDNAYVDIFYCGPSEDYVLKFLRDVFNVRNLTVTSATINTFCNAFQSVDLPTFPNMTSLNVHELYGSISYNFRKFLCVFPNIESLHFQCGIGELFSREDDEVVAAMFSFIPLNLKAIEVEMFHGDKHELFLIELFLKNARVLERMTIKYSEALLADGEKLMEWDRFIPNRSAMDFDYAHYAVMEAARKGAGKEKQVESSPSAYRKLLAETMHMNRTRILAFKSKPTIVEAPFPEHCSPVCQPKAVKPRRCFPQESVRTLDAPNILDDYYLNLLDWGSNNVLAIALGCTVYLWDASNSSTSDLVTIVEENGPITSVSWASDGQNIAVGLNNSEVQLRDTASNRQLRTLQGMHGYRVGSLDWNSLLGIGLLSSTRMQGRNIKQTNSS